jgi:hypothetical protein
MQNNYNSETPMLNRTELDPSDKRDLLLKIISCQAHGAITLLANDFSISRKSVYKARDAVLNAINELTSEQTEPHDIVYVGVNKLQIRRAIVALSITSANSIRAIQEQIPIIYPGCRVSFGYIQGVIVEAQQQAARFNKTVQLASIQTIAVDEMFSQGWAVLAGIDLDSGFLFSLSVEPSCDGDTWARVLLEAAEQGMKPAHVVKDGAKGIAKGVEMPFSGIEQRDDAFHAVYLAGKSRLKLERKAYRAIENEACAQKKYSKTPPEKKRSRAKSLDWAKKKCSDAIERYTLAEQAVYKIRMAFCSVNLKTGELVTVEMAKALFTSSIALLRETTYRDCISVALYLENRIKGLTLATSKTHESLVALQENYSHDAISLTCRLIERKRKLKKMSQWKRRQVVKEMAGAHYLLRNELNDVGVGDIIDKVEQLLHTRHMASSAIEGFNATLRAYLYVRKGVNQGFLDLFQAWHNLRPRRWGRHQGTSAYDVLTGKDTTDWLTLLGFPPSKIYH